MMMTTIGLTVTLALAVESVPVPPPGNVTLTLEEYNRLVELASKPQRKSTGAPPAAYSLKTAQLKLEVAADSVVGLAHFEGETFGAAGTKKVPLVEGVTVLEARKTAGGGELAVSHEGSAHTALFEGSAREFGVELKIGLPLTVEPGRASFVLPVPKSGAARLTLTVPGEQTVVYLSRGLITARSSAGGKTTVEATLQPGQQSTLWWASRQGPQPPAVATPKPVRFLSDVKTLLTISEQELVALALAEVTVVQGEPSQFVVAVPDGYELTNATGPSLLGAELQPGGASVVLRVAEPSARNHQFLLSFARANGAAEKAETILASFENTQRETGEVVIEGEGAMELTVAEKGGLRRMDLKETSPYLRSLAHASVYAAFRYQKKPSEKAALALEWTRFPDSQVLSAVAQRATVTTLVTSEGRMLTEVKLTLKNQSQPFLKVALPAGSSILSAEVAGERVKPVEGSDGSSRVPLLRAGFRPGGEYTMSFVFLHAGAAFSKKGTADIALPKMDVSIGLVEWEVFLPKQYLVWDFGGDVLAAQLLPVALDEAAEVPMGFAAGTLVGAGGGRDDREKDKLAERPEVTVTAQAAPMAPLPVNMNRPLPAADTKTPQQANVQSNVADLQRKVAGVLPIAVNVPRTGNSYNFLRPLVTDEETRLKFAYRVGK